MTAGTLAPSTLLRQWRIYLGEVFHPGSRLLLVGALAVGLNGMLQALRGQAPLRLGPELVVGGLAAVLLLLFYRVSDEFKDQQTDRRFFPERPVPSGRVSLAGLRGLLWGSALVATALNVIWPVAPLEFALLLAFTVAMRYWFFLERFLADNRLLAFLTHSPVAWLTNAYLLAVGCRAAGQVALAADAAWLALWMTLPSLGWELARKTRAPAEEQPGYQTYSVLLGARGSASAALGLLLLHLGGFVWLGLRLRWSTPLLGAGVVCALLVTAVFVRFLLRPGAGSRWLQPATEIYAFLPLLGILLELFLRGQVVLG